MDEREMGEKGTEGRLMAFQAARWRGAEREKGEGALGAWLHREGGGGKRGGPGMAISSVGKPATALSCRAWATRSGQLTRGLERDGGPGVSGGVRREWEIEAERQRGTDKRARATLCQSGGSNGILNRFKTFKRFTWIQKFPKLD
jgi:hypothetical protein